MPRSADSGNTIEAAFRKLPVPHVGSMIERGWNPRSRKSETSPVANSCGVWKSPNSILAVDILRVALNHRPFRYSQQSVHIAIATEEHLRLSSSLDLVLLEAPRQPKS